MDTRRVLQFFRRVERCMLTSIRVACFVLLAFIVMDVFTAVLCRYLFFYPLNFADQLAKYLVIWFAFLGATLAIKEGAHVSVDMLTKKLSRVSKKCLSIILDIVVSVFLVVIIYYGFIFSFSTKGFADPLVFGISMIYPYLAVPVGFTLILVEFNIFTIIALLSDWEQEKDIISYVL